MSISTPIADKEKINMNISDCKGPSRQGINIASSHQPDAAENVDSEDEIYFDALDHFPQTLTSASEELGNSENAPPVSPVNALFGHMVDKILYSISLRLLSRLGGLEELHTELRALAQSHDVLTTHLRMLCELLSRYHQHVPEHYQPLLNNLNELVRAGLSIYQLSATRLPTLFSEIKQFANQAEYLLSLRVVKEQLPAALLNQLCRLPMQMRKTADILLQAQLMPQDSSLEDWLLVIQQHGVLPEPLQQMLASYTQLWVRLRALHDNNIAVARRYPLPAEDNWPERINWILRILKDPQTARQIAANVPSGLVDAVKLSEPLLRMVGEFPAEGTLAQQLEWARQHAALPSRELKQLLTQQPLAEFINTLHQQAGNRISSPIIFNVLLILASPDLSLLEKSNNIIALCLRDCRFRGGIAYAMRGAARTFSGGALALSTWDWYQQLPAGLTWQQMIERFVSELNQQVSTTPQLLRELLPDYVLQSASTLSALIDLPVGSSWQDTVRWAIAKLGLSQAHNWICQRYIELCLIRGVCESLQHGDAVQREALLRDLAISLKDYFELEPNSELAGLVDLLPYLPLLSSLHETIKHIPATNSWLTWTTHLLRAIEQHPHPALAALRSQMETQIAQYLGDSLVTTFDSLWAQLPEFSDPLRFPEAEAAAFPQAQNDEKEETEFLLELFSIAGEYNKGNKRVWVQGDASLTQDAGVVAGLSAGWLASIYMLWRAYNYPASHQEIASDTEMQVLQPQRISGARPRITPANTSASAGIANVNKYILPMALLSGMGAATAWVAWQAWGAEKTLTLQQVFRDMLGDEREYLNNQHKLILGTNNGRTKRMLPNIQSRTVRQAPLSPDHEIGYEALEANLSIWNVSANTKIKQHTDALIRVLKNTRKDIRKEEIIIAGMIMHLVEALGKKINAVYPKGSIKSSVQINAFDVEFFIYTLILISKIINRLHRINSEIKIISRLEKTGPYKKIIHFIENELASILNEKHNHKDDVSTATYDFMCNDTSFGFIKFPQIKSEMEKNNPSLSLRNAVGVYNSKTIETVRKLVSAQMLPFETSESIISNKKETFKFFMREINEMQNDAPLDASLDEVEDIMMRAGTAIIDMLTLSDYEKITNNARENISKNLYGIINEEQLHIYVEQWERFNKSYANVINDFLDRKVNQHNADSYTLAASDAINCLFNERIMVFKDLLNNFTDIPGAEQQYALYIITSTLVNKIISFRQDWYKIQFYWKTVIENQEIKKAIISLYQQTDYSVDRTIRVIKIQSIKTTLKKINITPSDNDAIAFYDEITTSSHKDVIIIKEELKHYVQAGMYLLYQYMTKNIHEYTKNTYSPESYYSLDLNTLEKAAIPYMFGSIHDRNIHTLEQVSRESLGSSITTKMFYNLYDNYIADDARAEARIAATNMIYKYGDQLLTWHSVVKKIKSIENFKFTHSFYIHAQDSPAYVSDWTNVGEAKIITINDDEKYLYANFLSYPAIAFLGKQSKNRLSTPPTYEEIYEILYKISDIIESDKLKLIAPYKKENISSTIKVDAIAKDITDFTTIKDIFIDEFYKQYVNAARAQREKGNGSILDSILSIIPFYTIVKRKINDPLYHPTLADMKWDIINVGIALSLPGIKLGNTAFLALRRIFMESTRVLEESEPELKGLEKYQKIVQLSLPSLREKLPIARESLINALKTTANALNPVEPFQYVGTKISQILDQSIRNVPARARKLAEDSELYNMSVFLPQLNITPPYQAFQSIGANIIDEFQYIDEIPPEHLSIAKNQLPDSLVTDVQLKEFTLSPEGKSAEATQLAINVLQLHGYDTRVIGCLIYKNPLDKSPLSYYAAYASKQGDELMIDITYEQFIAKTKRKHQPMFTSWEDWVKSITSSEKLQNKLIIIKQFKNITDAKSDLAFFEGVNYLEANNIKDDEFQIINTPTRFIKHYAQVYFRDMQWMKNPAVLSMLDSLDSKIDEQQIKLNELYKNESSYIQKGIEVPQSISDEIIKVKETLYSLEETSHLPNRLYNYPYYNKRQFLTDNKEVTFSTPVSNEIVTLLSTPGALSTSENIPHPLMRMIETIDEHGLVYADNLTYLANNGKLFRVDKSNRGFKNSLRLQLESRTLNMNFVNFRWVLEKGSTMTIQQKNMAITKTLLSGSTLPLRNKGLLNTLENSPIQTAFDFFRTDEKTRMAGLKKFSRSDLKDLLAGKISTTTGNNLTSRTLEGPILGEWKQGDINNDVDFIHVSNGSSGCVGIRIAFADLQPDRPLIISAGRLSGCTMVYATDNKYFYAYHAGQERGDAYWFTSQQGVGSIYEAHLALKGTTIDSVAPADLKNQHLPTILSDYNSSLITYFGKNTQATGDTRIAIDRFSDIKAFDYNKHNTIQNQARVGLAYAVISKSDGVVNAVAYSEDLSISVENNKLTTLSRLHQRLTGNVTNTNNSIFDTSEDTLSDLYFAFAMTR
ncbi:Rho-activating domain of cytotoxic necrotizing factor [Cedecea davisae]|uniref:Cytotoxic necrotizing factor n=2 Tax=Cedecea davisae TaxID=158484 RepID=S3JUZ7_9ENTR|nr:cytotoxic necrotizing factor [Cedecea davisae DSM 4568]SUX27600.1 Rho-activating domain of cytotoxic necrotizing factor [Cedecea davisae]